MTSIAKDLATRREHALALGQLRNGASVAGSRGGGVNRTWCERLAEQSERLQRGGLSAACSPRAERLRRRRKLPYYGMQYTRT